LRISFAAAFGGADWKIKDCRLKDCELRISFAATFGGHFVTAYAVWIADSLRGCYRGSFAAAFGGGRLQIHFVAAFAVASVGTS